MEKKMPKDEKLKKSKENIIEVQVVFNIKAIARKGVTIIELLKNQTEFLAEPKTANGCVMEMKLDRIMI
jgi:hypothetical protein